MLVDTDIGISYFFVLFSVDQHPVNEFQNCWQTPISSLAHSLLTSTACTLKKNIVYTVSPFGMSDLQKDFLLAPLYTAVPVLPGYDYIRADMDTSAFDPVLTTMITRWMDGRTCEGRSGLVSRDDALCDIVWYLAKL